MNKLLILLFISFYITANSQILKVQDSISASNLDLVDLISLNPKVFAITNTKGEVDLTPFKDSEEIIIRSIDHETKKLSYSEIKNLGFIIYLHKTNLNLEEVNIAANKWHSEPQNSTRQIVNISQKDRNLFQVQTSADLLALSGKVFIQKSQQGGGSPMIRGFATNRLYYDVDGVRMNTAIFREGNIQNVISLDPFTLENTKVILGAGTLNYGSDAIGGVMSFQTLTPNFSLTDSVMVVANANTRFSSGNNEFTVHGDINYGWKKWSLLSSFTNSTFDDLKMGSYGPDDYLKPYIVIVTDTADVVASNPNPEIQSPSGYSQQNFMQKIRFAPNKNWDFQYAFHYSETNEYGRYDRHLRTKNDLPFYAEWDYGPQRWMMNYLQINGKKETKFYDEVYIRFALQNFEESRISRKLNDPEREINVEKVVAYSINTDLIKTLNPKLKMYYGAEVVYNDVKSTGKTTDIFTGESDKAPARYPDALWYGNGIYANFEGKINQKLTANLGARYSFYGIDATFDTTFYAFQPTAKLQNDAVTGNFGISYRPNLKTTIHLNLATAFRAPNVDDIGKIFDSQPNSLTIPNPDLKAEYAKSIDLTLEKTIAKFLKIEIAGFYTKLSNALVRRDFQLNGVDSIEYQGETLKIQAIQNAAFAEIYGGNLGVNLQLLKGFSTQININYQKGIEELDDASRNPSRHAAPLFTSTKLIYERKRMIFALSSQYNARVKFEDLPVSEQAKTEIYAKDQNGNPYTPEYYIVNFSSQFKIMNVLRLGFNIENITDQRYRAYSSGISGAGRSFIISASLRL